MADPRVEKLADVLVNYSVAVQPGDKVLIQGNTIGEPLLKAVYAKVLQADGKNESAIHWDMLCDLRDGGRIWVDDELMYEDGQFLIEL